MMMVEENRRVLWYAVPILHDRCIIFRMIFICRNRSGAKKLKIYKVR